MWFFIFAGVLSAIMCVAIYFLHRQEKRNREELRSAAERLGLQYSYQDPYGIAATYSHLNQLSMGIDRFAFNCAYGRYEECMVLAFDFQYTVDDPKRKRRQAAESHILSVLVLMMEARLPHLIVRPPAMMERFPALADEMQEVRVESVAFQNLFVARTTSPRFGEAILHPAMVDYLVKHPSVSMEINGNTLLVHLAEIMTGKDLESQLQRLVELYRLLPREVMDMAEPGVGGGGEPARPVE